MAGEIAEALGRLGPANAELYRQRAVDLGKKAEAPVSEEKAKVATMPVKAIFTYHSSWVYLGATLVGAAAFAWLRSRERKAPLEAFIGIAFATAQALVFLVLAKSPAGPKRLTETLAGALFTVDPKHVGYTAILYAAVGGAHFLLRRPLFEITAAPETAHARGRRLFWWDFLFYGYSAWW